MIPVCTVRLCSVHIKGSTERGDKVKQWIVGCLYELWVL